MKFWSKWFYLVIILCAGHNSLYADGAEFRTTVSRNDGFVGGEFHADLEMKISGGEATRTLHSMTALVYYSTQLSEWGDAWPGTDWAFDSGDGYSREVLKLSGNYKVHVPATTVGKDAAGIPAGWNLTTSWQKIVTLRWTINSATSVNIYIDDGTHAAAYFENLSNNPDSPAVDASPITNEDLGDTSLPVELNSFSVSVDGGHVLLNWITESEVANLGFNIYKSESENGKYEKINANLIEGAGNRTFSTEYKFIDEKISTGNTYWYKLEDVDVNGNRTLHEAKSVLVEISVPDEYYLDQNYPNPFNPSTTLTYGLPESGQVVLQIYNVRGEMVRELVNQHQEAGAFQIVWDATSENGLQVPTGLYFAKIKMGTFIDIKKCLFAK